MPATDWGQTRWPEYSGLKQGSYALVPHTVIARGVGANLNLAAPPGGGPLGADVIQLWPRGAGAR